MQTRAEPGTLPTQDQLLLLRAALESGDKARRAWEEWKAHVDIERIDHGSSRLLPLVYDNLRRQIEHDPLLGKLKGTYRLTWYQNQVRLHDLAAVLRALDSAGIRTMVLKGAALAQRYYGDLGLRPMGDLDILVPEEQARQAMAQVTGMGWALKRGSLGSLQPSVFKVRKDFVFSDATKGLLDMHWHLLPQAVYPGADDDFWSGAEAAELLGVPTCALNPSDQLLHVVVHGLVWGPIPLTRWVADAMMILRKRSEDLDWNRLTQQATKHRLVLPLREGLGYLRDHLQAPVPQAVLDELASMPVSRFERLEHRVSMRPRRRLGILPLLWLWHRRHVHQTERHGERMSFLGFLQHFWLLDHGWQVPSFALGKVWRKVLRSKKPSLGLEPET